MVKYTAPTQQGKLLVDGLSNVTFVKEQHRKDFEIYS